MKEKDITRRVIVSLPSDTFNSLPSQGRMNWLREAIAAEREDLIRMPEVICSENYIGEKSINILKRELGLG